MMGPSGSDGNLGETEAAMVLASEDLLSRDDIPNENQHILCFSCGEKLTGLFCHSCGQKNDDYRRSILSLIMEAFTSVFSLENRMWRTWAKLFTKPGKVSRDFADGKRTSWTSPIRMYLALSIILFGYMSLTETRIFSLRTDIVAQNELDTPIKNLSDEAVEIKLAFGFFKRQAEIDRLNEGTDFERVSRLIKGRDSQAFIFNNDLSPLNIIPTDELLMSSKSWPDATAVDDSEKSLRELALEIYTDKVSEAIDEYNRILSSAESSETIADRILQAQIIEQDFDLSAELNFAKDSISSLDEDLAKLGITRRDIHALPIGSQFASSLGISYAEIGGVKLSQTDLQSLAEQILRNPALLNDGISKYLPRIMFLMMPFAALIGFIFIRDKSKALLYDHLVHATYIHAVTFAFLFFLILLSQWTSLTRMMIVFLLGIAIYLPLSAKGMFQRGWFKTFLASYSIAIFYGLAMFIVITVLTVNSITDALKAGV